MQLASSTISVSPKLSALAVPFSIRASFGRGRPALFASSFWPMRTFSRSFTTAFPNIRTWDFRSSLLVLVIPILQSIRHEWESDLEQGHEPRTGQKKRNQSEQAEVYHGKPADLLKKVPRRDFGTRWIVERQLEHWLRPPLRICESRSLVTVRGLQHNGP